MSAFDFSGETAFVTGATSGIGRATALALAEAGARVIFNGVGDEAADAVIETAAALGGEARFVAGSLADSDGWKAVLTRARSEADGPLHLFVHCASPARREEENVLAVSEAQWDAMVNTNLRSGFFLAREIAAAMRREDIRGRMVFAASLHAETPRNLPHYSAAKAGQVMVVKELARALGPDGIRVNAVAPGAVPGGGFQADTTALNARIPVGETGRPEQIADGILTLLSDRHSGYVTGTVLAVDGGLALYNWLPRPDLSDPAD